jgi:hypothetical protein
MDLENQDGMIAPPNTPVTPINQNKKYRMIFQMTSMFCLFIIAVLLILLKADDAELKIMGIALISNLSGVILGKIRTAK